MVTETITLQVDPDAASIFRSASMEQREKLQLLLAIWLRQFSKDEGRSLQQTMDEISVRAKSRGLTPEALEEILKEE